MKMKKLIAAVLAIICVMGSADMGVMKSAPKTQSNSIVSYAASTVIEEVPGFNAAAYKYEYADSSIYTTSIAKNTKVGEWEENGNKYAIYNFKITHKENTKTVEDANYNRIGIVKANSTTLDFAFSELSFTKDVIEKMQKNNISEEEIGKKATIIDKSAFSGTYLKTIDLTGIEYIGDSAFSKCAYITEITIPSTVKYVGKSVFDSSGLKTLHVMNELPIIPDSFCSNTQLTDIEFAYPQYIRKIGKSAFKSTPVAAPIFNDWGKASGYEILTIDESAYQDCTSIKTVNVSDNVILINASAFKGCTSLSSLSLGESVIGIDKEGFSGCTALDTIKFNNNIANLGGSVFAGCTSLKEVRDMPDNTFVDWVSDSNNKGYGFGNSMFANCTSLESVVLPKSLTKIPESTFAGCTALKTITSSADENSVDNIVEIEDSAFQNCTSLIEAYYPNVVKVGNKSFSGCTSLKFANMPDLTEIGKNAFENCKSIEKIDYPSVTIMGDSCFLNCDAVTSFRVGRCSEVGKNALEGCTGLSEIELISDQYGEYVFKNCTGAKTISVNCDVMEQTIKGLFSGCSSLKEVKGDLSKIVIVAPYTFEGCSSLENINLSSVRIIEESAFVDCTSLKSICEGAIEAEDYGAKCFYNCKNLTATVKGNISTIGASAFQMSGITGVELNGMIGGTFVIGKNAFSDCPNLKTANIKSDKDVVFSVGANVFSNDVALTNVIYAGPIITTSMFENCTSLSSVQTNADSIQQKAFAGCIALEKVQNLSSLPNCIVAKDIGANAFKDCENLQNTSCDKNTTFSGTGQYSGCSSIKSAELGALTSDMFLNCKSLESVSLNNVTAVPSSAFKNCESLNDINIGNVVTFATDCFNGTGLTEVNVESAVSIGKNAFANCKKIKSVDVKSETIDSSAFANDVAMEKAVICAKNVNDNAFSGCSSLRSVLFQESDSYKLSKIGSNAFLNCNILYEVIVPGNPTIGGKAFGFSSKSVNPDFLLVGEKGSSVETYATKNKVAFADVATFDMGERTTGRNTPGDVDGNGIISIVDAVKLQNWLINKEPYGVVRENMDLNKDKKINVFDMIIMRQKIINK